MAERYIGGIVHTPDTQDPLCIEASTTPDVLIRGGIAFVRDESSQDVIAAAAFRPYEIRGRDLGIASIVSLVTNENADPDAIDALLDAAERVTSLTENGTVIDLNMSPEVRNIIDAYELAKGTERDAISVSLPALWQVALKRRYKRVGDLFVKMDPGYPFPRSA